MPRNKKALLEAALFMANEPMKNEKLMRIVGVDAVRLQQMLSDLKKSFESEEHGIYLLETSEGWILKTKPEYLNSVRTLSPYQDLSKGLLRVLALVAFKQPITQSEIVRVIGNRTYEYVKILESRSLLKAIKSGRSKALVITKGFLDYFGLEKLEDAKKLFEGIKIEEPKEEKAEDKKEELA